MRTSIDDMGPTLDDPDTRVQRVRGLYLPTSLSDGTQVQDFQQNPRIELITLLRHLIFAFPRYSEIQDPD